MGEHDRKITELTNTWGFWGAHPDHPLKDWQDDVTNGDTRRGYWEWVVVQIEAKEG